MIFEVPLPNDLKIYEWFAMEYGWEPRIEKQRSITEKGEVTIITEENPITAEQVCVEKVQEIFANIYIQRIIKENLKPITEDAKRIVSEMGIIKHSEPK